MSKLDELLKGVDVEWIKLGNEQFIEIANNGRKPVKASLRSSGEIPYYGANNIQDYVEGFTHDGEYVLIAEDGSSSLENYSIQYANGKFWANNHVHVLKGKNSIETKFLYYYLKIINFTPYLTGGERAKLTKGRMLEIQIPIPPIEIQQEIVRVLDELTSLTNQLTTELETERQNRKKQFEFFREQLFRFEEGKAEFLKLKEVASDFGRGKSKHRPRNDNKLYGGKIPFIQTGDVRNGAKEISNYTQTYSEFGLSQSKLWPKGTVCITIAANIAETSILGFDACFPDSIIGFVPNIKKTNSKYIYYLLSNYKSQLEKMGQGSAQLNINLGTFENLKFPIPSLEEQERIVNLLDQFDAAHTAIEEEITKEIKLRTQQYEYYREKLLSFPSLRTT